MSSDFRIKLRSTAGSGTSGGTSDVIYDVVIPPVARPLLRLLSQLGMGMIALSGRTRNSLTVGRGVVCVQVSQTDYKEDGTVFGSVLNHVTDGRWAAGECRM